MSTVCCCCSKEVCFHFFSRETDATIAAQSWTVWMNCIQLSLWTLFSLRSQFDFRFCHFSFFQIMLLMWFCVRFLLYSSSNGVYFLENKSPSEDSRLVLWFKTQLQNWFSDVIAIQQWMSTTVDYHQTQWVWVCTYLWITMYL